MKYTFRTARTAEAREESGMSWYVICVDCGSHTAAFNYSSPADRLKTAQSAAHLWNIGKIIRETPGD